MNLIKRVFSIDNLQEYCRNKMNKAQVLELFEQDDDLDRSGKHSGGQKISQAPQVPKLISHTRFLSAPKTVMKTDFLSLFVFTCQLGVECTEIHVRNFSKT